MTKNAMELVSYLDKFTIRKMQDTLTWDIDTIPDSLEGWMAHYLRLIIYEFLLPHLPFHQCYFLIFTTGLTGGCTSLMPYKKTAY